MSENNKVDIEHLRSWIGRSESHSDTVTPQLVRAFDATVLNRAVDPERGQTVSQGLHWCLTQTAAVMSELGPDGHPSRGGFLPPVPLPRRMWAGGRLRFFDDIRVGDDVSRTSTIKDVAIKHGRSGALCFVSVGHVYSTDRGDAIREDQDIVYREAQTESAPARTGQPDTAFEKGEHHMLIDVTPPLLFRYSALTFNGHRIHYDRPYATEVEHYGGLVVHGPLQASLLLAMARAMRPDRRCAEFSFRGMRPLLDTEALAVNGDWTDENTTTLWTGVIKAAPNMTATASW